MCGSALKKSLRTTEGRSLCYEWKRIRHGYAKQRLGLNGFVLVAHQLSPRIAMPPNIITQSLWHSPKALLLLLLLLLVLLHLVAPSNQGGLEAGTVAPCQTNPITVLSKRKLHVNRAKGQAAQGSATERKRKEVSSPFAGAPAGQGAARAGHTQNLAPAHVMQSKTRLAPITGESQLERFMSWITNALTVLRELQWEVVAYELDAQNQALLDRPIERCPACRQYRDRVSGNTVHRSDCSVAGVINQYTEHGAPALQTIIDSITSAGMGGSDQNQYKRQKMEAENGSNNMGAPDSVSGSGVLSPPPALSKDKRAVSIQMWLDAIDVAQVGTSKEELELNIKYLLSADIRASTAAGGSEHWAAFDSSTRLVGFYVEAIRPSGALCCAFKAASSDEAVAALSLPASIQDYQNEFARVLGETRNAAAKIYDVQAQGGLQEVMRKILMEKSLAGGFPGGPTGLSATELPETVGRNNSMDILASLSGLDPLVLGGRITTAEMNSLGNI
ncbi:unnamed protein product [Chrysoparadoxa australica]